MPKRKAVSPPEGEARRYGTMVRVSDEFAEVIRKACGLENVAVAEFADKYFLPIARERYRELLSVEYNKEHQVTGKTGEGKK